MKQQMIKTGTLYRSATVDRAQIDEESRTVTVAFSTEYPVERFFGTEILEHSAAAVRLGRLNSGGPVLMDHNMSDHVGVVEKAYIDSDSIGRAVVRFGRSARAEEVFTDVLDGIRQSVSVGYIIHKMKADDDDKKVFRAVDWEPLEVSLVSIPADPHAGIGRSEPSGEHQTIIEERQMTDEIKQETAKPAGDTPKQEIHIDVNAEREKVRKAELARIQDMNALGERHQCREMAQQYISEGKTVDALRAAILDKQGTPTPVAVRSAESADIGLTDKEIKRFSFIKAINAIANPNDRRAQERAAFELECSRAVTDKRGVPAKGLYVPDSENVFGYDWSAAGSRHIKGAAVPAEVLRRDLLAGTATDGAELVATNLLSGSFIDVLRNALVVMRAGGTLLRDLNGDVAIPRKTSGSAGGWIATEGGNAAQSDPQFDQVTMTPKTCASFTEFSRQLRLQSSLDVEQLVRTDLAVGLATTIDLGALYGSGASGQPLGVVNQSGIGNPTDFAGVNPTYAEVVAMETEIVTDNALMGALGYILRGDMRGALKTTTKDAGSGQFVWEAGDRLNGYPAYATSQVTAGDLFFGNWADLLIGLWGGLDLLVDPYTNSLSGTIRVVAHQSVDVAVRHPESFSHNNDGV